MKEIIEDIFKANRNTIVCPYVREDAFIDVTQLLRDFPDFTDHDVYYAAKELGFLKYTKKKGFRLAGGQSRVRLSLRTNGCGDLHKVLVSKKIRNLGIRLQDVDEWKENKIKSLTT